MSSCSSVLIALFLKHLGSVSLSLLPLFQLESRFFGLDSSGGLKTDLLSFRLSLFYLLNYSKMFISKNVSLIVTS